MSFLHARRVLLASVLVLCAACGGAKGGGGAGPGRDGGASEAGGKAEAGKSDGGSGGETGAGMGTPPLVTDPDATAMAISLSMVKDSSGKTPAAGDMVTLMFEPPSTAHLLALDTSSYAALAYEGTYTMTDTSLTLSFKESGFDRSGTIAFDPTKPTVSLPFQVFSSDKGTSTWNRDVAFVAQNVQDLFEVLSAASPLTLSLQQRASRALAYAKHYAAVHADVVTQALRQGIIAPKTADGFFWFLEPYITGVYPSSDGTELLFDYSDGSHSSTDLYSWEPRGTTTLTTSPLASDPRIDLAIKPVSSAANPTSKTAYFIAPFDSQKYFNHFPLGGRHVPEGVVRGFHADDNLAGAQSVLQTAGYRVHSVVDDKVTVEAIIGALISPTPGYVYFSTHGNAKGYIATGMFLDLTTEGAYTAMQKVYKSLRNDGLGDLLDYKTETNTTNPLTIGYQCVPRAVGTTEKSACYVALTPYFFEWLVAEKGADFSTSLVMMGACLTDHQPLLRESIKARAYFDYTITVPGDFAGAVFQYFGKSLARHSHSAEESYYNVLRVVNGAQMIYPEDALFQNLTDFNVTTGVDVQGAFHGYFPDGSSMTDYQQAGWLDEPAGGDAGATAKANPGSIWLLLFAGRWGGDAAQGSKNFSTCWKGDWSLGETGNLATWCGMAAPGYPPKPEEVAYANYLLTGEKQGSGLPAAQVPVARFTLDD